jgi:RecA/RadA recombinase
MERNMAAKKKTVDFNEATRTNPFSNSFVKEIQKTVGETAIRDTWEDVQFMHSGSLSLDRAMGGGYPLGRIIQIAGKKGYGKTSLALIMMREAIRSGLRCLWMDVERRFPIDYARRMGLHPDGKKQNFVLMSPWVLEDLVDAHNQMLDDNAIDFAVFDSVAAVLPRAEMDAKADDNHMMKRAKIMAYYVQKVAPKIEVRNGGLILINQWMDTTDYGRVYPGGNRKDHFCSIIIDMNKPDSIYRTSDGDKVIKDANTYKGLAKTGIITNGTVSENRVGIENLPVNVDLRFKPYLSVAKGTEIVELGREFNILAKEDGSPLATAAGHHWYKGRNLGYAKDAPAAIVEHQLADEIIEQIRFAIQQEKVG